MLFTVNFGKLSWLYFFMDGGSDQAYRPSKLEHYTTHESAEPKARARNKRMTHASRTAVSFILGGPH